MLPPKYIGAVMFGNGLSGISMNALGALCLVVFPPDQGNNLFVGAIVYFILAASILVLAAFAFVYVQKTEFVKYYVNKAHAEADKTSERMSRIDNEQNEETVYI